jgi:hypothetical protein
MGKKISFITIIGSSSIIIGGINFLILFFFSLPVPPEQMLLRVALPGLGFSLIATALLGRNASLFDPARLQTPGEEYSKALQKLGSVPVKMIAFVVILQLVFLGFLFLQGEAIGIGENNRMPLFLAALSTGMLAGTFVYVLTDSLVSQTLINANLTSYPRDLREKRQGLKVLIIPIAVTLITIFFVYSVTMLTISGTENSPAGMSGPSRNLILPFIGAFFIIVFFLAYIL